MEHLLPSRIAIQQLLNCIFGNTDRQALSTYILLNFVCERLRCRGRDKNEEDNDIGASIVVIIFLLNSSLLIFLNGLEIKMPRTIEQSRVAATTAADFRVRRNN